MKQSSRIIALLSLAFMLFIVSCKKSELISVTDKDAATPADTVVTVTPTPTPAVTTGRVLKVGTGSGELVVDGTTLGIKCDDVIKIQAGTYSHITIKNINVGCNVTVQNDGLVEVSGSNDHFLLSNVSNLTITGNGTSGITKGFVSRDNAAHRSFIIDGTAHDLTIQYFSFKNIADYVIYMNNSSKVYTGAAGTYSDNIKFLNIDCNNTGSFLQLDGGIDASGITGLVKNLEIAYLNFTNSNSGYVAFIGNADDYNIHHNTINNVNTTNNNHNGLFTVKGSGSFHHNLVRDHQGNAIRAWARSLGSTPKNVLIYNNTVVNSRKYSAFEVQSFQDEIVAGKSTYVNIKVYGNICGELNKSKDWVGVILDIYSLFGGKIEVYNNTGFNFPAPSPTSNIINIQSITPTTQTNNIYYQTAAAAGISNVNTMSIQN
jgi:hypothetical protein